MTTRDIGDSYGIEYQARDPDSRALVDVTVVLTIRDPSGSETTPTPTHVSTGIYRYAIPLASAGTWSWQWDISGAVTDIAVGDVLAAVSPPAVYATLDELRDRIDRTDTTRDEELQGRLEAASRQIDDDTGRRFWLDRLTSSRILNPSRKVFCDIDGERLFVPDIGTTTGLVVEIGTVVSGVFSGVTVIDYEVGATGGDINDGWPIEWLLRPLAPWRMAYTTRIRVTARWGWPQVPAPIRDACLLLAHRRYRRRGSPEGVAGFSDQGVARVTKTDPDYDRAIAKYRLDGLA